MSSSNSSSTYSSSTISSTSSMNITIISMLSSIDIIIGTNTSANTRTIISIVSIGSITSITVSFFKELRRRTKKQNAILHMKQGRCNFTHRWRQLLREPAQANSTFRLPPPRLLHAPASEPFVPALVPASVCRLRA